MLDEACLGGAGSREGGSPSWSIRVSATGFCDMKLIALGGSGASGDGCQHLFLQTIRRP